MAQSQVDKPAPQQDGPAADCTEVVAPGTSRARLNIDTLTPMAHNGCFDIDRVIKSGYVEKRTSKTKTWKTIYIVLRSNTLSMYKNEKETKLRHQIHTPDLTAVAFLKDPKHKRHNVFGLFSPSKNFHLQAPTAKDAQDWVDLIRKDARIEEEEEEMFLASPLGQRHSPGFIPHDGHAEQLHDERLLSSSPEPYTAPVRRPEANNGRRRSSMFESSGLSGNELASHSDFSDNDVQRLQGASIESLAVQTPNESSSVPKPPAHPAMMNRSLSQASVVEQDPDRVIWQGWLWLLRTKGGVRQWKDMWGVLRPRNLILYKDGSEYTAQWIVQLSNVVNVVDIDPLSKSKTNCLQVITEEKSYRFCAHDEESLLQCLGAFKSLLAKRRGLEARAAATVA